MQSQGIQEASDRQYRSLFVVWCVFVISQVFFFAFSVLVTPNEPSGLFSRGKWLFAAFALVCVLDSFVRKRRMLVKALNKHDPSEVNQAYVMALLLSEAAGLIGFLLRFEADFRYYYMLFALAVLELLFNFPRKDHVLASYEVTN